MVARKAFTPIIFTIVLLIALSGCSSVTPTSLPTLTPLSLGPTPFVPVTGATFQPTAAPPATSTPVPQPSPTLTSTPGSLPSATATASQLAAATPNGTLPPVPTKLACNSASFVTDVSVPPATSFDPGALFTKTWRIQNTGSCSWASDYSLVFSSGDPMSGPTSQGLPDIVDPGQTINISVNLTAPPVSGTYSGAWLLADGKGNRFGIGAGQNAGLMVAISVTPPENQLVDLTASLCSATWKTQSAAVKCPSGGSDFAKGSIRPTTNANGSPILAMAPAAGANGMIKGTYPVVSLDGDDHFQAAIGCASANPQCSFTFQVDILVSGSSAETTLQTWKISGSDGLKSIDLDLSSLGYQNVQLVLVLTNLNSSAAQDEAIWVQPQLLD
jgi:hypothetical protein